MESFLGIRKVRKGFSLKLDDEFRSKLAYELMRVVCALDMQDMLNNSENKYCNW